jgi:hypothetical protein
MRPAARCILQQVVVASRYFEERAPLTNACQPQANQRGQAKQQNRALTRPIDRRTADRPRGGGAEPIVKRCR